MPVENRNTTSCIQRNETMALVPFFGTVEKYGNGSVMLRNVCILGPTPAQEERRINTQITDHMWLVENDAAKLIASPHTVLGAAIATYVQEDNEGNIGRPKRGTKFFFNGEKVVYEHKGKEKVKFINLGRVEPCTEQKPYWQAGDPKDETYWHGGP